MTQIGTNASVKAVSVLSGPAGVAVNIAALAVNLNITSGPPAVPQVLAQNVAPDIAERAGTAQYPIVQVYCGKLQNLLREKSRTFSGTVEMIAEVRISQDRLDGLEVLLQLYVEAVTAALDQTRGDWGSGMFYTGGYEVSYTPVKHGGRNFLQTAKVTFVLDVSV
jgi:hypothetical protein